MDALQYILNHHVRLQEQTESFLGGGEHSVEEWNRLKKSLNTKSIMDKNYLFPEVVELSSTARQMVVKSLALLENLDKLVKNADQAIRQEGRGAFLETAMSLKLALAVYLDFIQKQMLPLMRSKMPTYVREELSDVLDDVVNSESELDVAMYA